MCTRLHLNNIREYSIYNFLKGAPHSHLIVLVRHRYDTISFTHPKVLIIAAASASASIQTRRRKMPKVKTNRVKIPEGWELIEPTLRELQAKMREAENDPHDGKRKCETLWPIFKIAHQKSRYIFDLYYRRKEISKELYEFCLDQGYADRNLIAKWKKPGYERLCCLRCMQPRDHNFQTTCVCRVPKNLREEKVIECVHCGCRGCASGD
ncbi:protein BUD31 [Citrus sinensis]|nr:protein BUD31 [Citrus sinensis]